MRLLFATKNQKKLEEVVRMSKEIIPEGIELISLNDIPEARNMPQAAENGRTFEENAHIKAMYWADRLNVPVFAEDSGLMIDALNGYPGVNTKRAIADFMPGKDVNIDNPGELYPLLLARMRESGESTIAQWVCAMTLVYPNRVVVSSQKSLTGNMCDAAGKRVFGFDQYFKPKNYDLTLSQLSPEEKDKISPRREALKDIFSKIALT